MTSITYYYDSATKAFFSSEFPGTITANGFTPETLTEISLDDYEAWFNPPVGKSSTWEDGKPVLIDTPGVDYVAVAEQTRQALQAESQQATYSLNLKLMMGRTLTDAEKATVNAWLDYSDALLALDLSTAPDIEWPQKPGS